MSQRVPSLDLLRGMAALAVAIPHYFTLNSLAPSDFDVVAILAVEVFFVLSGYVLAPQILYCIERGELASIRVFLIRRWMRTIPPYLVALLIMSILTGQLLSFDFVRYSFYIQNFFAQHNQQDYFPIAWSLSVEEWFYVIFPFGLWVFSRLWRRESVVFCVTVAVAFIAVIAVARFAFGDFDHWDANVRRVVIFRVDSIAVGFVLYCVIQSASHRMAGLFRYTSAWPWLLFSAATVFAITVTQLASRVDGAIWRHVYPLAAAGFGVSAIVLAHSLRDFALGSRAYVRFCSAAAAVSYSTYLFHLLFVILLRPRLDHYSVILQLPIYLGLLVGSVGIFYRYFEKPILDARPSYVQKKPTSVTGPSFLLAPATRLGWFVRSCFLAAVLVACAVLWRKASTDNSLAFFAALIALTASIYALSNAVLLGRNRNVLVTLSQILVACAVLLPAADYLHRLKAAPVRPAEAVAPSYSYEEAHGNPAAFVTWWRNFVAEWNGGLKASMKAADPKGILPAVLVPNSGGRFFDSYMKINSLGFRGPEFDPVKKDQFRIVTIGESVTFNTSIGAGARPWPEVLQSKFDTEAKCSRPIEIINAAVEGYDLADSIERVKRDVLRLRADLILSYHSFLSLKFLNPPQGTITAPPRQKRPSALLADLEYRFNLWRSIRHRTEEYVVTLSEERVRHSRLASLYRELFDLGAREGFKIALATSSLAVNDASPRGVKDFYGSVFQNIDWTIAAVKAQNRLLNEFGQAGEAAILDTTKALSGAWKAEMYHDLLHYTRKGADLMAQTIFDGLVPVLNRDHSLACVQRSAP